MISIIAAIGKNREIGQKNGLLWHIPEELKHFKKITMGHPIIMGRKTFESIGRPLPGRINIIISRSHQHILGIKKVVVRPQNLLWVNSLEQAVAIARLQPGGEEIFIIGGASVFSQALPLADKLYLTIVHQDFPEADAFFPNYSQFKRKFSSENKQQGKLEYNFIELEK